MKKTALIILTLCFGFTFCQAQDMVYKPKNPAFGGDTFNYNWLLSSAQVQDQLEDPDLLERTQGGSTLDDFTESLNRQLLTQLSRQLITNQFGEDGLEDGNYTVGDFQIDVTSSIEGLVISILDSAAGEQTQVIIPYF